MTTMVSMEEHRRHLDWKNHALDLLRQFQGDRLKWFFNHYKDVPLVFSAYEDPECICMFYQVYVDLPNPEAVAHYNLTWT